MARKKETCSQIAGKRLKMARFDVFGLTQNDLVERNAQLPPNKRGIAEKWISVFGKQQAARTLSRWENQGIPESRISDVAFCFNAEPEFFTDSGITEEHFCQLIRQANNGNAFLQRPEKNMLEMAAELGITRAALNNFFRILEIRNIPPEELDAALRKFAGEYREMLSRLEKFRSDDPQIMALKTKAKAQLDSGCFDKADVYLEKAVIRDRETAMQMQETLHRRMLSAAQTTGERGDLEHARLNYRKAAVHYQNAAELVPAGEQGEIICAEYRTKQGMAHRMAGEYGCAQAPLETAVRILEKHSDKYRHQLVRAVQESGWNCKCIGEYETCEILFEKALHLCEKATEHDDGCMASVLKDLGLICEIRGKCRKAEYYLKRAWEIRKKRFGENDSDAIHILEFLGTLHKHMGRFRESEQLLVQSLEKMRQILGHEHPSTLVCLNVLGELYCDLGRYKQAEPLLKESLDKVRSIFGTQHQGTAISLGKLGELYSCMGRYGDAEIFLQESLDIVHALVGNEHLAAAITLERFGTLHMFLGRYAAAEKNFRESLFLMNRILGENHYRSLSCMAKLCETCIHLGSLSEAEEKIQQVMGIAKAEFGDDHPCTAASLMNLGLLCKARGQYDQSIAYFRKSAEIMKKHFDPGHRGLQSCRENLDEVMRMGNAADWQISQKNSRTASETSA